jgi:TRAP-type C4-dicarboxylate transport system permease small subunit
MELMHQSIGKKIWQWLCTGEDVLRVLAIVAMTVLVFSSILLRHITAWAYPAWDELARYIMIWSIMAGAIVTSREDEHIKMGFIKNFLNTERRIIIHDYCTTLITFIFLIFFTVWSYKYMVYSIEDNLRSIVTDIPMVYVHSSFVVGTSISVLHFAVHVIAKTKKLYNTIFDSSI